jgi:hypothetical protein
MELGTLNYAACGLDCEGSITISHSYTKQGWLAMHLIVAVANIDRSFVEFYQNNFGGRIYSEEPKKLSKRLIYRWKVNSNEALKFLETVRPYLKIKGDRADLAILWQKSNRRVMSREKRESFWLTMKALNKGESPAETKRIDAGTNLRNDSPTLSAMAD